MILVLYDKPSVRNRDPNVIVASFSVLYKKYKLVISRKYIFLRRRRGFSFTTRFVCHRLGDWTI